MELLAVIVVIAVIAIITVPSILGVIERVNKASFKDSVLGYIESAQMYLTTNIGSINENDEYVFICDGISCSTKNGDKLNFKGSVPKSGIISIKGNGEVTVENLYNGRYYANKDEEGTITVDNEVPDTLSRDELTKLVYELKDEVKTLNAKLNAKANQTDLEVVSTVAQSAKTTAEKAATASSLESVSTIANNAKTIAEGAQTALASKVSKEEATLASHPVGSIFVSTVYDTKEKVSEALGGTWEVYGSGRTLIGADGSTYKAGNTGGSSSVTLATANLPSHNHELTPSGTVGIKTNPTFTGTSKNYTSETESQGHTHGVNINTNGSGSHNHGQRIDYNGGMGAAVSDSGDGGA